MDDVEDADFDGGNPNSCDLHIANSLQAAFRGIARIDLDKLNFERCLRERRHRQILPENVKRLQKIFELEGCLRYNESHHVSAVVDEDTLARALARIGVAGLPGMGPGPLLTLEEGAQVDCLHGLHRVAAAKAHLRGEERWWTVRLYCTSSLSQPASRQLANSFDNAKPFTDGEILWNIRHYVDTKDKAAEKSWMARLSDTKRKDVLRLSGKPSGLIKAFDSLLDMPAMWRPIRLGTLHRLLCVKCDEEMLNYLGHIRQTWTSILGDPPIAQPDENTISSLQLLCPGLSTEDADTVEKLMDSPFIFPTVVNTSNSRDRTMLMWRIQSIKTLIPSFHTFFEGLIYLEPCCKVLKELLDPGVLQPSSTLFRCFTDIHRPDSVRRLPDDSNDRRVDPQSNYTSILAGYQELWLWAFQHLWELTDWTPRKETYRPKPARKAPNPSLWQKLAVLAQSRGFRNESIDKLASNLSHTSLARQVLCYADCAQFQREPQFVEPILASLTTATAARDLQVQQLPPVQHTLPAFTCAGRGEAVKRRSGHPYEDAYLSDLEYVNLDNVLRSVEIRPLRSLTAFFVHWATFRSFFQGKDLHESPIHQQGLQSITAQLRPSTSETGYTPHSHYSAIHPNFVSDWRVSVENTIPAPPASPSSCYSSLANLTAFEPLPEVTARRKTLNGLAERADGEYYYVFVDEPGVYDQLADDRSFSYKIIELERIEEIPRYRPVDASTWTYLMGNTLRVFADSDVEANRFAALRQAGIIWAVKASLERSLRGIVFPALSAVSNTGSVHQAGPPTPQARRKRSLMDTGEQGRKRQPLPNVDIQAQNQRSATNVKRRGWVPQPRTKITSPSIRPG